MLEIRSFLELIIYAQLKAFLKKCTFHRTFIHCKRRYHHMANAFMLASLSLKWWSDPVVTAVFVHKHIKINSQLHFSISRPGERNKVSKLSLSRLLVKEKNHVMKKKQE